MTFVPEHPSQQLAADDAKRAATAQTEMARADLSARSLSLNVLAVLAVFYTLSVAASIVLPFLFALVLNLLLQPAKRFLTDRLRFPHALAALALLVVLFSVVGGIGFAVSVPASGWIARAPQAWSQLQPRLGFLSGMVDFVHHGMDQLQHLTTQPPPAGQPPAVQPPPAAAQPPSNIAGSLGGVGLSILDGTRAALGQLLTLIVVLFFLLTAGDSLLRGLVEVVPTFSDKRRVVEIANEIERNVSGYLVTITIMNLLVGLANGAQMWALGMPDPLLWGTVAFFLNYIPILGPISGIAMFFFVGLFSTSTILWALVPPAVYLLIHIVEGETVTPMLLARRFTLNPVLVIVSLFFWDWLWGVSGALMAVPLLAIFKIVADRIPPLMPLGHILGGSGKHAKPAA